MAAPKIENVACFYVRTGARYGKSKNMMIGVYSIKQYFNKTTFYFYG